MNIFRSGSICVMTTVLWMQAGFSQSAKDLTNVPLDNLDAFREHGNNWQLAADVTCDYSGNNDLQISKGKGIVVNQLKKGDQSDLFTSEEFGNLELELDFMMPKNSNSGIYFQGRYEVQLFDSWKKINPTPSDLGGIYYRWTDENGNYEGTVPAMNVAKAPGLWQHITIKFRAPVFNEKGEKISNARFEQVYINNVLVQQNAEVTGPTRAAMYNDEKSTGPLVFQGDHGSVAFRNIRYRKFDSEKITTQNKTENDDEEGGRYRPNPIYVHPKGRPTFIKTFLNFGSRKLTHVISVGHPNQVNYSYDLKQGALFQVWRGQFIDVTQAWFQRGENQLGVPLGSVIMLGDAPAVAALTDENAAWPDSIAFDDMHNKGYVLDKQRTPSFIYTVNGMNVKDSIVTLAGGEGLSRTISIENPQSNVYCRIVSAEKIETLRNNLFAVNDKSYYVQVDNKYKPVVRQTAGGKEIIVKYESRQPVTYTLIW